MGAILTLESALRDAVNTAQEQPAQVPQRKADWISRAQAALDAGDMKEIRACADEIRLAHSQYHADFDEKGWLYELRKIRFDEVCAERQNQPAN